MYTRSCCFSSRLRLLILPWIGRISAHNVTERSKSSLGPGKSIVIGRKTLHTGTLLKGNEYIALMELCRDVGTKHFERFREESIREERYGEISLNICWGSTPNHTKSGIFVCS